MQFRELREQGDHEADRRDPAALAREDGAPGGDAPARRGLAHQDRERARERGVPAGAEGGFFGSTRASQLRRKRRVGHHCILRSFPKTRSGARAQRAPFPLVHARLRMDFRFFFKRDITRSPDVTHDF